MTLRAPIIAFLVAIASGGVARSAAPEIRPLLERYCYSCHGNGKTKGDLTLDGWKTENEMLADKAVWHRVEKMVARRQMPPEEKPQPSDEERSKVLAWIDRQVFNVDCNQPDPGRVTLRRLNRAEYNNTIRDLLGVDFQPADDFPVDSSGYGFDTIGDALSLPPLLMEKYLGAAEKVLGAALGLHVESEARTNRYPVDLLEVGYNARQQGDGWVFLNSVEEDDVAITYHVATAAEYRVRVKAYARQEGTNAMDLTFMCDDVPAETVAVSTNSQAPEIYECRLRSPPGKHRLRAVVRRNKAGLSPTQALKWKSGAQQKGAILVQWLEVAGPFNTGEHPEPYRRIFTKTASAENQREVARSILEKFARRAYRRPGSTNDIERLTDLAGNGWKEGDSFEEGVELALQAILVSPHFLFRGELQPEPDNPAAVHPIDEFSLASRLSYFIWSSMPDDELFAAAESGQLRSGLETQVRRMLRDPKSQALVDNFAGQWLQLRNLALVAPDRKQFKNFDEQLREAMQRETELFFETILREDRSIIEFLTADYTFMNERLARHYGLEGIKGDVFQKVSLQKTPRRGLLTQASVLTLTSNPTRTSPVKRGKWILDNLLNAPPPPPPPNVPELSEADEKVLSGTLRQRMEQHRENPLCASCHERMDPLGFALENFDALGAWRDKDGEFPIDARGQLGRGDSFDGPTALTELLAGSHQQDFVRAFAEKMLLYALGRGIEYYDKCALDRITADLARKDYKFSELVLAITKSVPFQMRRGEKAVTSQ